MATHEVAIVRRMVDPDMYYFEVLDAQAKKHVVQMPKSILSVIPKGYEPRSDDEHLEILAKGIVMAELNPETCFHNVERECVNKAYRAVLGPQKDDSTNG